MSVPTGKKGRGNPRTALKLASDEQKVKGRKSHTVSGKKKKKKKRRI